jgi:ABC-2 type transport system permease protein
MNSILLIIQREFLQRIRKRSFLVMTILGPLFFSLLMVVPAWLTLKESENQTHIALFDPQNILKIDFIKEGNITISTLNQKTSDQEAFIHLGESDYTALLYIKSPQEATLYNKQKENVGLNAWLKNLFIKHYTQEQISNKTGLSPSEQNSIEIQLKTQSFTKEEASQSQGLIGLSLLMGIIIYLFILTYTMQVLRGFIQEKTSRINELLLSSVKPFQLMMGKIVGIGMVSITQFAIWLSLTGLLALGFNYKFGDKLKLFNNQHIEETIKNNKLDVQQAMEWNEIINTFSGINIGKVVVLFLFYFVMGYLLYSAIFAAIAAMVDAETETQQLVFPLTIPILLCFMFSQNFIDAPESPISVFFSIFPLTSPIAMMLRLPIETPSWLMAISMFILLLSFIATTWIAGKIYKTGMLMYGNRASFSEVWRWIRSS